MSSPVVTIGHKFEGWCNNCQRMVSGVMVSGVPSRRINGQPICVSGSVGLGDCGHTCEAVGLSEVVKIDGLPVVRLGDPVTGIIEGKLVEGSDFVKSD